MSMSESSLEKEKTEVSFRNLGEKTDETKKFLNREDNEGKSFDGRAEWTQVPNQYWFCKLWEIITIMININKKKNCEPI